jgi:UDP-glucose 4-epimerase
LVWSRGKGRDLGAIVSPLSVFDVVCVAMVSGKAIRADVPARDARVVAVTGTSSFVGQNLLGLLDDDPAIDRVVAIDVKPPSTGKKTRFYEVDLTQPAAEARLAEILAAERVRTLVHLAFHTSPSHATAYAHELESIGTMHLLVAARQARVRKVVMGSLTLLYGAHPSNPNFIGEHQPLRAPKREPFFADKIEAEAELGRFAERSEALVTVLRTALILGPTVKSFLTRYLARRLVMTMMGFDPLLQFVHEIDVLAAFKLAVDRDLPGTFNVCGDGVLPLSTVIKLAGRVAFPVPHPLAEPINTVAWMAQLAPVPSTFLPYLRFLCVADGARARDVMGFRPAHTTREALTDFVSAQRLRDVKLLQEM